MLFEPDVHRTRATSKLLSLFRAVAFNVVDCKELRLCDITAPTLTATAVSSKNFSPNFAAFSLSV